MLAVGNGLSTIITNSQYKNRAVMFDTGIGGNPRDWWKDEYAKSNFVANYLKELGINQLDAIFISHDHSDHDHTSNLETIVSNFTVKNIYGSHSFFERYQDKTSKKWPQQWADLGISPQDIKPNYKALGLSFDNLTYKIYDFINKDAINDENNQSLVLSFAYQNHRFLLTGDTEKKVEQELMPNCKVKCN
ncbi:MBL fold metallo-hydrolase [Spiroplasma endosymbiont of Asaphidion curtum]|uniref:MBL fold metallo-hydrolase n=1 Tax=Spiroplasma endosymbiont of Asaphidion curtum TaxID=3066281 RepID=UPI00313D72B4